MAKSKEKPDTAETAKEAKPPRPWSKDEIALSGVVGTG